MKEKKKEDIKINNERSLQLSIKRTRKIQGVSKRALHTVHRPTP
jgi:hypothetical protein